MFDLLNCLQHVVEVFLLQLHQMGREVATENYHLIL